MSFRLNVCGEAIFGRFQLSEVGESVVSSADSVAAHNDNAASCAHESFELNFVDTLREYTLGAATPATFDHFPIAFSQDVIIRLQS